MNGHVIAGLMARESTRRHLTEPKPEKRTRTKRGR
jgi:ribosomal protein L35